MRRRRFYAALCLLSVPLLLTGCWQDVDEVEEEFWMMAEEETADENQTVLPASFSLPYDPEQTLDPVTCPDGMQQVVASLLFEGLFSLDANWEPQGLLCSDYTYDPQTLTYVFTLREGVSFSDSSPLTGDDVRDTLNRARTSLRYGARLSGVKSISAGESTVSITLSQANTAFPALLDIPIVKSGTEDTIPLGTGPYLLADDADTRRLVASQNWWQGSTQPVEHILLVETADTDAQFYRFSSRDVQLITTDLTGTQSVGTLENVSCTDAGTTILQYLGCNTAQGPLTDPALRRCLSLGINRPQLVSAFLSGHGTAAQFPLSPLCSLYPSHLEIAYSSTAFSQAVKSSSFSLEEPLVFLVNTENTFKLSIAQYLCDVFTDGGVPVELRSLPWEEYTAALQAGDFDLYYGEVKLCADWNLSSLLSYDGSLNYGGWSDEQTQILLNQYAAAQDPSAAMESLCAYLQQTQPIIPLCFKSTSVLTQSGVVEGLSPTAANPLSPLSSLIIHLQEK